MLHLELGEAILFHVWRQQLTNEVHLNGYQETMLNMLWVHRPHQLWNIVLLVTYILLWIVKTHDWVTCLEWHISLAAHLRMQIYFLDSISLHWSVAAWPLMHRIWSWWLSYTMMLLWCKHTTGSHDWKERATKGTFQPRDEKTTQVLVSACDSLSHDLVFLACTFPSIMLFQLSTYRVFHVTCL